MTLNDLENLNGHFRLNVHYYEPHFQQLRCIPTVVCIHT